MRKNSLFISLIATLLMMAGCSTPFVNPPIPASLTPLAGISTAAGAAVGVVAGGATGSALTGAGVGAVIGLGIGSYTMSTHHLLKTLQCEGIQVVQIGEFVRIIIPSDLLFEFNSATIRYTAVPSLETVMLLLSRFGNVPLTITGYTDNVLSPSDALLLTTRQAKSVTAYFWSHGIPFNELEPIGMGSANDVATNGNSLGSFYNRRIEITLKVIPLHGHRSVDWMPGAG